MSHTRCSFQIIGTLILSVSLVTWSWPSISNADDVKFEWKSKDATQLKTGKEFIEKGGGTINTFQREEGTSGMGPTGVAVMILAGSAAVCVLAESISRVLREYRTNGGLELEARRDKVVIKDRPDLKTREVEIRRKDGTVIKIKDEKEQELCKALMSVLGASESPRGS
jgi:hypothetical protein